MTSFLQVGLNGRVPVPPTGDFLSATMAARILFLVPVFNQKNQLVALMEELRNSTLACDTLLFVDDGSTDGSTEIVKQGPFPYITVPRNTGIGHAFIRAIEWALERNYEIFGSMAANGKMLPAEMPRILNPILKGEAHYVTGSRYLSGGASPNLPAFRRHSIPMVNRLVWLLTGAALTDTTCGYRAFRLDLIQRAQFDWRHSRLYRYGFESYFYAKVILDRNIRWMEVPITMRYPPKGESYSKIKPVTGWYDILKPWFVARWDGKGFGAMATLGPKEKT
jgi:dolichol-phosphate mannosyltransferase